MRAAACHSASASHMFPIPATIDWSSSVSPSQRVWSGPRIRSSIASKRGGRSRMSGPSRAIDRVCSSSTGPFQSTPSARSPRRTSHGVPARRPPSGVTVQRPDMRRWERSTTPPSKRKTRFFPSASTDSSTRPSIRSAIRSARARGCGASTDKPLADQRLETSSGTMDRVPLGHGRHRNGRGRVAA